MSAGRYISEKESEVMFPVSPLVLHPVEPRPRFQQGRRPSAPPVRLGADPAPLKFLFSIGDKSCRRVRYVELPFPYFVANYEMPPVLVRHAGWETFLFQFLYCNPYVLHSESDRLCRLADTEHRDPFPRDEDFLP